MKSNKYWGGNSWLNSTYLNFTFIDFHCISYTEIHVYLHGHINNHNSTRIDMNCHNPVRCLSNKACKAFQYQGTKEATCMLILRSCGAVDRQIFQPNDISQIYEKGLLLEVNYQNVHWLNFIKFNINLWNSLLSTSLALRFVNNTSTI